MGVQGTDWMWLISILREKTVHAHFMAVSKLYAIQQPCTVEHSVLRLMGQKGHGL